MRRWRTITQFQLSILPIGEHNGCMKDCMCKALGVQPCSRCQVEAVGQQEEHDECIAAEYRCEAP